ncbi:amidase [Amylibacter kogurei]|uniref:Amidase n=1 Tax=Paramylibacter kogurei TaxID=1889778 RepID=A0A2G5K0X2_9RHOB|nr:amidase family protein [Amylibacter kogurei]PIB23075.1 amidase [Amylibacter kogurei]
MNKNWLTATASDLGRGIEAGEIDPVALTQTYLDAIDSHQFSDRIYTKVTHDRAMSEAKAAATRATSHTRQSLLDGVPISWKDLFDTAGTKTEAGSALLKNRTPTDDALVLQNATNAGLVCLGKTHMSELAFSGLGLNPVTQTPPNVNDYDAIPGGSSSGAAASVGFNLAAAGIGSDTGGSVRIPSAWNDLVGLKTTSGDISLQGVVPLCARFDTVGPLTRSVEDAAHLYAILKNAPVCDLSPIDLSGRKIAIHRNIAFDHIEIKPENAFYAVVEKLKSHGAIVTSTSFEGVEQAMELAGCLFTFEAYAQWGDVIEDNPDLMYQEILHRFRQGKNFSKQQYDDGWTKLLELRRSFDAQASEFKLLLAPTAPIMPPNLHRLETDSDYFVRSNLLALRNTRIGNLMGLCALTLPTNTPSCGVMLMGRPFQEHTLLQLGKSIEAII